MTAKRKATQTPEAEIRSEQVGVMLTPTEARRLDDLRRAKDDMPTRSTLCRALIVEGLERAEKKGK